MNRGSFPRQNRVTPRGNFEAVTARGSFLGNRGRLHDSSGNMGHRAFAHRSWICCFLEFRGRHRTINAPASYTELFALDEATFLAAGHRPCADCRRDAFDRFKDAWRRAHGLARPPRAAEIDAELHSARLDRHGRQRTHTAQLGKLPDGAMIVTPGSSGCPALVWRGHLYPWRHEGYAAPLDFDPHASVIVLTPRPTTSVLGAGYSPAVALGWAQAGISRWGGVSTLVTVDGHPLSLPCRHDFAPWPLQSNGLPQ